MKPQPSLFDTAPYQPHSATSKAAADKIVPKAGTARYAVLEFIKAAGKYGATDDEIQTGLFMNPSTERPRRVELAQRGLIVESGLKRMTRSKCKAVVWVVKE